MNLLFDDIMRNNVLMSTSSDEFEKPYSEFKKDDQIHHKKNKLVKQLDMTVEDELRGGGKKVKKVKSTKPSKSKRSLKRDISVNSSTVPTGGFPPIFICTPHEKTAKESTDGQRSFATKKGAVPIREIMKDRLNITPFLTL
jgi:hypothetical protein